MRQSQLFSKTRKETPRDETAKNAILLTRAGYISKELAGVYSYLPLGLRVIKKIENIIREEINKLGALEVLLPALQSKESWLATDRWETMTDLYKLKDASDRELALGPTHEEVVVPLLSQFISSYQDLPISLYQFQTKFRMELRAKSGLLRGREFIMKDLYSFHRSEEDLAIYYERVTKAYKNIFAAVGLGGLTYLTLASGGNFAKFSHEFQTLTEAGEDTIHLCNKCRLAVNSEVFKGQSVCPQCGGALGEPQKAIEVGNIFKLGTRFTKPLGLTYKDERGVSAVPVMGSYGIGLGRLMGTVAEVFADDKGLVWPQAIAPFQIHLVEIQKSAEKIYKTLTQAGIEVLWDDRDVSPGEKFTDVDLLGLSVRIVVSERAERAGGVEVKQRANGKLTIVSEAKILEVITTNV